MYLPRIARTALDRLLAEHHVVVVTGPRQAGKSTLCRQALDGHDFVSLADPLVLELARASPRDFCRQHSGPTVIAEAQRAPELLTHLERRRPKERRPGHYVLTCNRRLDGGGKPARKGSRRVGQLTLLPFSLSELTRVRRAPRRLIDLLFQGLYPAIHDHRADPKRWYPAYLEAFLEHDLPQILSVRDLGPFRRFLQACAQHLGEPISPSTLGGAAGVSGGTARKWLTALEQGFVVGALESSTSDFGRRLIKTPKLYFLDPGLAAWLLGIRQPRQLAASPQRQALFESWVFSELLKSRAHRDRAVDFGFWRDRGGLEIDFVLDGDGTANEPARPIAADYGSTLDSDLLDSLEHFGRIAGDRADTGWLAYGGARSPKRKAARVVSWRRIEAITGDDVP